LVLRARKPLRTGLLAASLLFNPTLVRIDVLRDAALSWHIPAAAPLTRGARMYMDAPRGSGQLSATVRSIMRTNPRLSGFDALQLAVRTLRAARAAGLDPGFLAATLLQESAFDPAAVSWAGAVGIGQFMVPTADLYGLDPFAPGPSIDATARLLSSYVARYRGRRSADPYALALAAYNAGSAAVERYGGVPPYDETRAYIVDVRERWSRIVRDR
jgi:soluble lytic murein transglycosylase-like protein